MYLLKLFSKGVAYILMHFLYNNHNQLKRCKHEDS